MYTGAMPGMTKGDLLGHEVLILDSIIICMIGMHAAYTRIDFCSFFKLSSECELVDGPITFHFCLNLTARRPQASAAADSSARC